MSVDSTGLSINYGQSYNPYLYGSTQQYYNDPYLLAALQQFGQTDTTSAQTSVNTPAKSDNVSFTSAPQKTEEKKNKHVLLKTIAAVGAATTIAAACKGHGVKPSQIGQGYKELWSVVKNAKWVKKVFNPEKFTMHIGENNEVWYTGLGKNNILKGDNVAGEAEKLGIETTVPKLNGEGVSIADAILTTERKQKIVVKDGKITKYIGTNGRELINFNSKNTLDSAFKKYLEGAGDHGLTLSEGKLIDTSEQGIRRIFNAGQSGWKIAEIETNRFAAGSDAVGALYGNETIKKFVEARSNAENLKNAGARPSGVSKKIDDVTVNFENGKVKSIIQNGTSKAVDTSTDAYKNWLYNGSHQTELDNALKAINDGKFDGFNIHSYVL